MFHAKDDPYVPAKLVNDFAKKAGIKLTMLARGGHVATEFIVEKYWMQINKFFEEKV